MIKLIVTLGAFGLLGWMIAIKLLRRMGKLPPKTYNTPPPSIIKTLGSVVGLVLLFVGIVWLFSQWK
ncbi:MAG: hypothetical protein K6347_03955 [Campylobacterales bacterium]